MTTLTSNGIAEFGLRGDPGADVLARGQDLVARSVTRAISGVTTDATRRLLDILEVKDDSPGAYPVGLHEYLSVSDAALVTGFAADSGAAKEPFATRILDAVVAAALAISQYTGARAAEVLTAVVVGSEVGLRLAEGLGAEHRHSSGWDVAGTVGTTAAAVAAGRLVLSEKETFSQALGIAATQGAGLLCSLNTVAGALHVGRSAAIGVEASLLASNGLTGPTTGIEGRRGLAVVIAPHSDLSRAGDRLGGSWLLAETKFAGEVSGNVRSAVTRVVSDDGDARELVATLNAVRAPAHTLGG